MEQISSSAAVKKRNKQRTPGTVRVVVVLLALCAQLLLVAYMVNLLQQRAVYLYFILEIAGAVMMTVIITKNRNSAYTIAWLIIMMVMPVFGYLLFFLWGTTGMSSRKRTRIQAHIAHGQTFLQPDQTTDAQFLARHPTRQKLRAYLQNEGFPIYQQTQSNYYPLGELQFEQLIADLEQAQKYIFLEYFIVAEGQLWDRIHDLLRRKAQQGVEVRILIDDLGSIERLPDTFAVELQSEGIQAARFNQVHKNIFRMLINNRNHQKITVIDGNIGYTGGTNIADEYVNLTHELGHWKDVAVRLEGAAVWALTVTFLQMWDAETDLQSDYPRYRPTTQVGGRGFYQPFADGPLNNPHTPAEELYRQIIAGAQRYVYITTPYLVIDDAMKDTLCMAAKGGVDVRIVTPKIWDHWYVHMVTKSNYDALMSAGVRIYEYTPGFIHAKIILSDDDNGVISSINMDYRSFFLLFEFGVWICGAPVLADIKADLLNIFAVSEEKNLAEWRSRPQYQKFLQHILRIFAPLF